MQPSELPATPKILGHYEVEHTLGEGRYGTVYLARDPRLDRQVAIKVLRKSAKPDVDVARVFLEARIAASLDHRHICRVYDVGEEEGLAYIAMEYVDGSSLLEALDSGALNTITALRYAVHVCEALTYAHEKGVIHGDIKASNVLISPEAEAKLADFGQAISSETSVNPQSDIYAFGDLLHCMVTGTLSAAPPMTAGERTALPDSVPTGLATIIERCLEPDPARRYRSARQILRDLRMEADRPPAEDRPAKKPPASRTSLMIAGGAATILLLLALAFTYRQTFHGWGRGSRQGAAAASATQSNPAAKAVVWLNKRNKIYHCPDSPWYGKTVDGGYMTEKEAVARGFRPAYGKSCR